MAALRPWILEKIVPFANFVAGLVAEQSDTRLAPLDNKAKPACCITVAP